MCLIVDANRASAVLRHPATPEFAPIIRWISERGGRLVYGGRLKAELARVGDAARLVRQWSLAGLAVEIDAALVAADEASVYSLGLCCSNDHHVIALARIAGARVLCTEDANLMKDFRNAKLVKGPRGHIYRTAAHEHLLRHTPSCGLKPNRNPRRR